MKDGYCDARGLLMTAAEAQVSFETEQERIEAWRMEALLRAGYGEDAATKLATRLDVDLHVAIGLVNQGCSPELALQILL
jgi:hypothetical protein